MSTSSSCFSNPADLQPGTRTRNASQSAQSGYAQLLQLSG